MRRINHRITSGFTLTEMAIVLAVVGVLAAGLWNILSGANTQVRDQSTSDQQAQLISAAKSFLTSSGGQSFLTANNGCALGADGKDINGVNYCEPGAVFTLPLPATAACAVPGDFAGYADADDVANLPSLCTSLPPGFSAATTNPYNQSFQIKVARDASTPAKQPPASFSFMILTQQGAASDVISDTSGARISSLIGGDGGFVYSNNVCNAQTGAATIFSACGSFGSWNIATGAYGFGAAGGYSGSVASRTYVSPEQILNNQWLARLPINGDIAYNQNAMTVPEYLGDHALVMGLYKGVYPAKDTTPTFYLGDYNSAAIPTTGGGTMEMQAGVINFSYLAPAAAGALVGTMNVQGGAINLNATGAAAGGGAINMQGGLIQGIQGSEINLQTSPAGTKLLSTAGYNAFENLATSCTFDSNAAINGLAQDPNCVPALQITGDETIAGYLSAYALYSATFIYDSSGKVSDARAKKDIVPIHNALDDIEKLKPVSYKLKTTGKTDMGFLAQDIEKIYPELVMQNQNGYKAVDYEGLVAPLVGAVQELRQQNDNLREELKHQAVSQKKLEDELRVLKQQQ